MARSSKIVTTTAAVSAQLLGNGSASMFYGLIATGAGNNATYYIKIWWEGSATAPPTVPGGAQSTTLPTAGTTVPNIVIQVPAAGVVVPFTQPSVNNGGRIWYWIATGVADSSTTVLATGGDAVTFIYD